MSLKQSIIIRNEYTNNVRSEPGKGSRGASPGQYVMRYMAREDATEILSPVEIENNYEKIIPDIHDFESEYDSDGFTRYIARSEATEKLKSKDDDLLDSPDAYGSPLVIKHRFKKMDKLSGRAFGSSGMSLRQDQLEDSSEAIQEAFDNGHSVQKIILSFEEEYLRETGVLDPEFKYTGRGSYMGHIDQVKLRTAISKGVNDMTKAGRFADPEWVGTIQMDTGNVHSHIALVDKEFSSFRMKDDGADKGKINEQEKYMFRKGIHFELEDMTNLKSFHKQASTERQNVSTFVKDYAHSTIRNNSSVQLLLASLPKERTNWRYGTNRESMKYPNELATNIVNRVFNEEPEESGYDNALQSVYDYADESRIRNKLSDDEYDDIILSGREHIIERSVNGLYSSLKTLNTDFLQTRTYMTDIHSSSDEDLARALKIDSDDTSQTESDTGDDFDTAAFILRVRGYGKRIEIHETMSEEHFDLASEFDEADDAGMVDDSAHVMRIYYEEEQRYHMGLTDKYRKLLLLRNPYDEAPIEYMTPKYESLVEQFGQILENEEESGQKLMHERNAYTKDLREYTFESFQVGVATLREWDAITDYSTGFDDNARGDDSTGHVETRFVLPFRPDSRVENLTDTHIDDVKAYDVHHLGLDYYSSHDTSISPTNTLNFANKWGSRQDVSDRALIYVNSTNQVLPILENSLSDLKDMSRVVDTAVSQGIIETVTVEELEGEDERQLYTTSSDYSVNVSEHVRDSLEQMNLMDVDEELDPNNEESDILE